MAAKDKGAVQHADSNSNRSDKGAVEKSEAPAGAAVVPVFMHHYTKNLVG